MPSRDIFAPITPESVKASLSRAKKTTRENVSRQYDLAIDYLENRQLGDVESELRNRYERTQSGRRGQTIAPQAVPLTQRFADEVATVYSKEVDRKLVDPEGNVNESLTEQVNAFLGKSNFDERMSSFERRLSLLKSGGIHFQPRKGKLKARSALPQDIHPIAPDDRRFFDPHDQEDYEAFSVELSSSSGGRREYAYMAPSGVATYTATSPFDAISDVEVFRNGLVWPQVIDTPDGKGIESTLPLQMLGIWSLESSSDSLIAETDVPVHLANRELNLQLSVILDTIAHQGWATPVYHALNPDTAPTVMAAGPRFGLTVGVGETLDMLTSAVSYTDLIGALESFVKLVAIFESMSPNDFSLAGVAPQSGFAKMVDNLPKIARREKQAAKLARIEASIAWPRIAVCGIATGEIDGTVEQLAQHKLVTSFSDVSFPESTQEKIARQGHEIDRGITSAAVIVSKRDDVSMDDAIAQVNSNLGKTVDEAGVVTGDVQKTVLNGAQTEALVTVVTAVSAGQIPRESAVKMIETAFKVPFEEADALIGEAGRGFVMQAEQPPQSPQNQGVPQPPEPTQRKQNGLLEGLIRRRQ